VRDPSASPQCIRWARDGVVSLEPVGSKVPKAPRPGSLLLEADFNSLPNELTNL
jgi:hypothetical protein